MKLLHSQESITGKHWYYYSSTLKTCQIMKATSMRRKMIIWSYTIMSWHFTQYIGSIAGKTTHYTGEVKAKVHSKDCIRIYCHYFLMVITCFIFSSGLISPILEAGWVSCLGLPVPRVIEGWGHMPVWAACNRHTK